MTAHFRLPPIRSKQVLNSAKGEPCTARFPGVCNGDSNTTVWCHLNGAAFGKGMGQKAHDVLGFWGCGSCHTYYDVGHGTNPKLSNEALIRYVLGAVCETYVGLIARGIVVVPQDEIKPLSERPVPPRKPKDKRAKIPSGPTNWPKREMKSRNDLRKEER